jgi:putative DNA primase/helicase
MNSLVHVPAELRLLPQWLVWRFETVKGRRTKPPYRAADPTRKASSTDPRTWSTFQEALATLLRGDSHCDGVGFVIAADDPFVGCDLDHCRDAATGALLPAAQGIVDAFATYAEASVSGTGVHIIMRGHKPAGAGCRRPFADFEVELYESGRYFCMTGDQIGEVSDVRDCQAALDEFCAQVWPAEAAPADRAAHTTPVERLDDRELVAKMLAASNGHNVAALYGGDLSAYSDDHSRADAALLEHLAWWTNGDAEQMERIFRSSGLYREKWERADYRQRSIAFAIEANGSQGYSARASAGSTGHEAPGTQSAAVDPQHDEHDQRRFHLTELGNAERLAARHAGSVYAVRGAEELRGYDRARGIYSAEHGLLVRYATDVVRAMYREAGDKLTDEAKSLRRHAALSESKKALDAMLSLAQSLQSLEAEVSDFDADPDLLNTASGVVDLRSGELLAHSPTYRMTKIAGCGYDPDAPTPMWNAFLECIFAGDRELIAFMQRLFGYALTGYTGEQIFAIFFGAGANGKSVLVDCWQAALGDYAAVAAIKTFLAHRTEAVRTDLATLHGRRLVSASESKPGQVIDAATIKVMTSRHVTCRFNYARGEFTYTPNYLVVLDTNFKPRVECDDYAIKRRVLLVPFNVLIPEAQRDKKLTEKLIADELPGILAWGVKGACEYLANGLRIPETVRAATDEYRAEMDQMHEFWGQWLVFGEERAWTTAEALRDALDAWAKANGVETRDLPKGAEWGRQLRQRGARSDKKWVGTKTVAVWYGVRIAGAEAQEELL